MNQMKPQPEVVQGDCLRWLQKTERQIDLAFLDPPFNQGRFYRHFNDNQTEQFYWGWIVDILSALREKTRPGGAIYFMQREKNAEFVLSALRDAGWTFQNLIVWKKMASAVPSKHRFGKHYQIIALATNGVKARVFNKLRIDLPIMPHHRRARDTGVYVTDVWDDVRELTSGYYAGAEPVRAEDGQRFHKQQSPIALLLRIILSSSCRGDTVFDPFAGTGTTLVVANQLNRQSIGVEIDPHNVSCIKRRVHNPRESDDAEKFFHYYRHTQNLAAIWGKSEGAGNQQHSNHYDDGVGVSSVL